MEARPPVGELRGMTGAARLGRERGLERGETRRRRALRCEWLAPVAGEELLNRVGAGDGDEAEHRQRSDRCRIRGCYPFLRTRSQNPRRSMSLMGAAAAISRRSRSPVTSTSVRLSIAEALTKTFVSTASSRIVTADLMSYKIRPISTPRQCAVQLRGRGG